MNIGDYAKWGSAIVQIRYKEELQGKISYEIDTGKQYYLVDEKELKPIEEAGE